MATTFLEMVEEIESTAYVYPHERVAAYEKLRGMVDETFDRYQRRCAAIDVADIAQRDEVNGHPSRWRLENALNAMRIQIDERIRNLTRNARPTRTIRVQNDTTLASLSYDLNADLDGLISLNPSLNYSAIVRRGTDVRFYVST